MSKGPYGAIRQRTKDTVIPWAKTANKTAHALQQAYIAGEFDPVRDRRRGIDVLAQLAEDTAVDPRIRCQAAGVLAQIASGEIQEATRAAAATRRQAIVESDDWLEPLEEPLAHGDPT